MSSSPMRHEGWPVRTVGPGSPLHAVTPLRSDPALLARIPRLIPSVPKVLPGRVQSPVDGAMQGIGYFAPPRTDPVSVNVSRADSRPFRVCRTDSGRELTFETFGAADGLPIFFMHGMPGSRIGPYPRSSAIELQGIRLIGYDRPGYGGSSRQESRDVAAAADDVLAIADDLGIDRFAVVGRSGGGPHALAVAARLPERVTAAAVLVSAAPSGVAGLDWCEGMVGENVAAYTKAASPREWEELRRELAITAERTLKDPENFILDRVRPGLQEADLPVVEDFEIRKQLREVYLEALRNGVDGWFDDIVALQSEWGFGPDQIKAPTLLWHGEDDAFVPVNHVHWLASQIPCSEVRVERKGHFGAVTVLPRVLSWLADRHQETVTV